MVVAFNYSENIDQIIAKASMHGKHSCILETFWNFEHFVKKIFTPLGSDQGKKDMVGMFCWHDGAWLDSRKKTV